MAGEVHIIRLFSKACRNEQFTSEELSSANFARRNLIPLLDEEGSEFASQAVRSKPSDPDSNDGNTDAAPSSSLNCTWTNFAFPPRSLTALKSLATKTMTMPLGYVSTDDTLSAFIWQSVTRARLPRLKTGDSTFARAVDVRQYLDISSTYPAPVQNMTYVTYTLQNLIEEPLGGVASQLRSALDPRTSKLGDKTRALVTLLSRSSDKSIASPTATLDSSVDVVLSSWAKFECHELDFGLGLGTPEAVRRPRFDPVESLVYLMPRSQDGEIVVTICLRDEDLERLRADEEFAKYGTHIG
ncbi:MAG: hypothetical protein Q9191_004858 [Dirinaria sp. TL-2023a]